MGFIKFLQYNNLQIYLSPLGEHLSGEDKVAGAAEEETGGKAEEYRERERDPFKALDHCDIAEEGIPHAISLLILNFPQACY